MDGQTKPLMENWRCCTQLKMISMIFWVAQAVAKTAVNDLSDEALTQDVGQSFRSNKNSFCRI